MRVTSNLWVSALIKRAQSAGAFATIINKGASEAGAIFVCVNDMQGKVSVFGPAPQSQYDSQSVSERDFECILNAGSDIEADDRLSREKSFDPDIWIVEIEDRESRSFIEFG